MITAIVQARMSSTRLPAKVLKQIAGKEILGHVLGRLAQCRNVERIVVAATLNPADEAIVKYANRLGSIETFRGSEEDVLDRYYKAAQAFGADWIVRVTSDSPLIDPEVIDCVIATATAGAYDYAGNSLSPTMPDGLDVECMSFDALARAWTHAKLPGEREHVTPYIRMNPQRFKLANIYASSNYSRLCWAVDSPEDFQFIQELARYIDLLDPRNFAYDIIIALLRKYPHLGGTNDSSVRDCKLIEELPDIFTAHDFHFDNVLFERRTIES